MGQEEALLPARAAVAFSWEHEQGLAKQVRALALGSPDVPDSPRKAATTVLLRWEQGQGMPKPAVKPPVMPESARNTQAPTRRLSVPPPPGRKTAKGSSCAVRPEDDPFLAAYMACTKSTGGRGSDGQKRTSKGQRQFTWARLRLGGLSCKRDNGAVEQSMVRMAKLPEVDPRDA